MANLAHIDAEIISAWSRYAADAWDERGDRGSTEQSRADENYLTEGVATSPSAAAAKLRYALYLNASAPWLEAVALGAVVPDMHAKIALDGAINATIWSTIQSLEAMEAQP